MANNTTEFEIYIRPNQGWFNIDWKGLRDYRDLLLLLIRREFVSKYQQTVLGPLWFIINPLLTTLVFSVVFGSVVGVHTDGIDPTLFYMGGLVAWSYFSTVLSTTAGTFTGNAHLFGKVYFPRLIVPIAMAASQLFTFFIQLFTFALMFLVFRFTGHRADGLGPNGVFLLMPLLIIHMAMLGLGVGMALSSLTAKYRDFVHLSGFLVQLWMYGTPIIYPLDVDEKIPAGLQWLGILNPMTMVVEAFRFGLMGHGTFDPVYYGASFAASFVIFMVGLMLFQRSARTFVDTV